MRLRLLVKMPLKQIILGVKVTMNIETAKKPCFGCFCRFVSCAFILTLRKTYIKVFPAFFCYFSFQATYCCFQKLSIKLLHPTLNFDQKEPRLMASPCTSLLLCSKLIQRYHLIFKDIEPKSTLYKLMRLTLSVKKLLMEITLGVKVTMNIRTTKKPRFGYYCRYLNCALTLRRRNTNI